MLAVTYTQTNKYVHCYICTLPHFFTHTYTHTYAKGEGIHTRYTHTCAHTHTHSHTYTRTHTHTHAHTHSTVFRPLPPPLLKLHSVIETPLFHPSISLSDCS